MVRPGTTCLGSSTSASRATTSGRCRDEEAVELATEELAQHRADRPGQGRRRRQGARPEGVPDVRLRTTRTPSATLRDYLEGFDEPRDVRPQRPAPLQQPGPLDVDGDPRHAQPARRRRLRRVVGEHRGRATSRRARPSTPRSSSRRSTPARTWPPRADPQAARAAARASSNARARSSACLREECRARARFDGAGFRLPAREGRAGEHLGEPRGERAGIARREEQTPRPRLDDLRQPPVGGRDHRHPADDRLGRHQAQRLGPQRRHHGGPGRGELALDAGGVLPAREGDDGPEPPSRHQGLELRALGPVAHDPQARARGRGAGARERLDQERDAFLAAQPPHEDQQRRRSRASARIPRRGAATGGGGPSRVCRRRPAPAASTRCTSPRRPPGRSPAPAARSADGRAPSARAPRNLRASRPRPPGRCTGCRPGAASPPPGRWACSR